jgi:hypothetical protein
MVWLKKTSLFSMCWHTGTPSFVIAGLDPAIQLWCERIKDSWAPGSRPGVTNYDGGPPVIYRNIGIQFSPDCQVNGIASAEKTA